MRPGARNVLAQSGERRFRFQLSAQAVRDQGDDRHSRDSGSLRNADQIRLRYVRYRFHSQLAQLDVLLAHVVEQLLGYQGWAFVSRYLRAPEVFCTGLSLLVVMGSPVTPKYF